MLIFSKIESVFMLFLALGKAKGPAEFQTVPPILNITPPPETENLDSPEAGKLTFRLCEPNFKFITPLI